MRRILLSVVSFVALCALVGCGNSSPTIPIPQNPSGGNNAGFSTASLSGTYVFTANGTNFNSNSLFATAGTFVADGNGNIASGTRDTIYDTGPRTLDESITGTYSVNQDGRGQAVLNGHSGRVIYRFVLASPTVQAPAVIGELFQDGTDVHGNVQVDATGTIQQVSSPVPPTGTGTYVVRLDGEDPNLFTYGAIGGITITGGNFTGTMDENDGGTYTAELSATGAISLSSGRGTATLTTSSGPNSGLHNFIVYSVSPSHFVLLSSDSFFLHGYADQQTGFSANTAAFSGDQVFSISGFDQSGGNGNRVEAGRLTLNGDGTVSNAFEDYNTTVSYFPDVSLTGSTYAIANPVTGPSGRWTASLANGSSTLPKLVGWQVSPQKSILLTTNNNILETGTMVAQTLGLSNASISGNYAQVMNGVSPNNMGNVEITGNLSADGNGAFPTGTFDSQTDLNNLGLDTPVSGNDTYTIVTTTGRATGTVDGEPVAIYAVDAHTLYFVSAQQGDIYRGALFFQAP
jgi:hypothetical protein